MGLTTRKMSDAHEEHLAEVYGGRVTAGSGNQPANPMDVRQHRYDAAVAFAIDGKSTRAASMSITREMLAKAREQAHGERPMIAVRFYDDDRLRSYDDWAMVQEDDMLELLERSARLSAIEEQGCLIGLHLRIGTSDCSVCGASAYDEARG
jgi:hypothetical protein